MCACACNRMVHFTRCPAPRRGARGWHTAQCPLVTVSTHPSRRPSRPRRHWARTAAQYSVVDSSSNLVFSSVPRHRRQLAAYRRAARCTEETLHILVYRQRYGQPTVSLHVKLYRPHYTPLHRHLRPGGPPRLSCVACTRRQRGRHPTRITRRIRDPTGHRQPAHERGPAPQRTRGTSTREKKRPPLFPTYSADAPRVCPGSVGVHMRALAARLCASRSRAGRPATARTPRRSAGIWTSTRPPRRSPPVAAARGEAGRWRGEREERRGERRGGLGRRVLACRTARCSASWRSSSAFSWSIWRPGGGARWERAAAGALWRGGEGSRGQPNGGPKPKGGSRRNGGERASRLLQRAPHRLHVSPPGGLGSLVQHQRRLLWSGDQAAEREGGGGRLSNRDGADERAPPPSRARVRTSANRREAAAARP